MKGLNLLYLPFQSALSLLRDEGRDLEDGQEQRDDDRPDDDPQDGDDHRFDEARQRGDGGVHFVLVEVRDLRQHLLKLPRALPHRDHAGDHGGKHLAVGERVGDILPFLDAGPGGHDGALHHLVPGRLGDDLQGTQDGHAGLDECRERPGEAGDEHLLEQLADDRNLQDRLVEPQPPAGRADVELEEADEENQHHRLDNQVAAHELAQAQEDAGRQRQLAAEGTEDLLELRDDHHDEERRDADGEQRDERRIEEAGPHFPREHAHLLDVGGDAVEDLIEAAGRLARPDHVDEEIGEDARGPAQRFGEAATRFDIVPDLLQRGAEVFVLHLVGQDVERGGDGNTTVHHRRELAREDDELIGPHPGLADPEDRLALGPLLDREHDELLLPELLNEGVAGLDLEGAAVGLANFVFHDIPEHRHRLFLRRDRDDFLDRRHAHLRFPQPILPQGDHAQRLDGVVLDLPRLGPGHDQLADAFVDLKHLDDPHAAAVAAVGAETAALGPEARRPRHPLEVELLEEYR